MPLWSPARDVVTLFYYIGNYLERTIAIQLTTLQSPTLAARTGQAIKLPHNFGSTATPARHRGRCSLAERTSHTPWFATRADLARSQWRASQRLCRLAAGPWSTNAIVLWAL